jgi:SAM-dependent methyltransferase
MSLLPTFTTDPTPLFERRDGVYADDLLITAVSHLDLFTRLARNPCDLPNLCHGLDLAARPADVMLTLFTALGLVRRNSETFTLTDLAREHLVADAPGSLVPYFASLKERPICQDILTVLQTGRPFGWGSQQDETDWHRAMERADFAESFTAAMDARGAYLAPRLAQALPAAPQRLLDIAGGSGLYACAAVSANPQLRAVVLEKPPVHRTAERAIARRGLQERVSVRAGDMFSDPLPRGFDLHLYANVLHDWDEPETVALLQKSWEALPPGGRLAIFDTHLNADKSGPLPVAEYSVFLMLSTQGKCYSVGELQTMLETLGFTGLTHTPIAAHRSLILAQKPTATN